MTQSFSGSGSGLVWDWAWPGACLLPFCKPESINKRNSSLSLMHCKITSSITAYLICSICRVSRSLLFFWNSVTKRRRKASSAKTCILCKYRKTSTAVSEVFQGDISFFRVNFPTKYRPRPLKSRTNAELMEVFVVSTDPSVFVGLHTVEEDFSSKAVNHHMEQCETAGWFCILVHLTAFNSFPLDKKHYFFPLYLLQNRYRN